MFVEQLRQGKPLTLTEPLMTRYLMSLGDSVNLVLHAFFNAQPGDLFVQKAPASTVEVLAQAVAELLGQPEAAKQVIGIRHGEKMHETLLSREEMAKAEDQGQYFRVPLDARSLQYELYFSEGDTNISRDRDYTSENTDQLDIAGAKDLLMKLPEIQELVKVIV